MDPKVSICIPTYNEVEKLEILLISIRSQTFRDFEVIVSDDSTTQDVKDLLDNYGDLGIRYIHNSPSKGSPENWNHAISLAKGTWIKLMHHDDYFTDSGALLDFLHFSNLHPSADYIFCNTKLSRLENGNLIVSDYTVDQAILNHIKNHSAYLFPKNIMGSPSIGFHRKTMNVDFDKKLQWLVDVEYFIQILRKFNVFHINKPLVATIISKEQLSHRMSYNPDFELYELVYCYNKLSGNYDTKNRKIMRMRFIFFVNEFKLYRINQVKKHTKELSLPMFIKVFFVLASINIKIANSLFYRLNKYKLK